MNCTQCGAPVSEGAKFCTTCGAAVVQQAVPQDQPVEQAATGQQPEPAPQEQAPASQTPQGQAQQPKVEAQAATPQAPQGQYQQQGYQQPGYQQPGYQQQGYQQPGYQQSYQQQEVVYTTDGNKRALAMSMYWASIIGIIMCVSVCDRRDEFIRFHLNQAFVLFIFAVICLVLSFLIIPALFAIFVFVCVILGTISAHKGTCKEVPLLGKIRWLK